jgi:hypothetical protein
MTHSRSEFAGSLRGYGRALSIALLAIGSACSSHSAHPSLIASNGGSNPGDFVGDAGAGEGGASDAAGASSIAGAAGIAEGGAGTGGTSEDGAAGKPVQPGPPLCSATATWATATAVDAVSTARAERLLSVTPDELDLAFLREGELYVAHRSKASAAFAVGASITLPAGWSAKQGAALSSDAKRLVLVSDPDQKKLGELTRATRDQAFAGEVDESPFNDVNQDAIYAGQIYASPVLSAGDDRIYFNSGFPGATSTVVVSTRAPGLPWKAPVTLTPTLLDGASGQRRLPTGISADERTLFYFNEESSHEEARFRASSALSSALYDMRSLGERRGATPNSACDRLYSESGSDVVVEKD